MPNVEAEAKEGSTVVREPPRQTTLRPPVQLLSALFILWPIPPGSKLYLVPQVYDLREGVLLLKPLVQTLSRILRV